FADEVRRPAPPPLAAERRSDPLAGFTPEPIGSRAEPRPDPIPPRLPRTEPLMPRPQRPIEPPKAPPPVRAPERAAAPPPPPPPPAAPTQSSADQNLAEMAQPFAGRPTLRSRRRSRPSHRPRARPGARLQHPRLRRRRAALRISKTKWPRFWAAQRTLREIGASPA